MPPKKGSAKKKAPEKDEEPVGHSEAEAPVAEVAAEAPDPTPAEAVEEAEAPEPKRARVTAPEPAPGCEAPAVGEAVTTHVVWGAGGISEATAVLKVPAAYVGNIIGKGGATIKRAPPLSSKNKMRMHP